MATTVVLLRAPLAHPRRLGPHASGVSGEKKPHRNPWNHPRASSHRLRRQRGSYHEMRATKDSSPYAKRWGAFFGCDGGREEHAVNERTQLASDKPRELPPPAAMTRVGADEGMAEAVTPPPPPIGLPSSSMSSPSSGPAPTPRAKQLGLHEFAESLVDSPLHKFFTVGLRWWLPLSRLDGFTGVAEAASRLWENTVLLSGLMCSLAGRGHIRFRGRFSRFLSHHHCVVQANAFCDETDTGTRTGSPCVHALC